jgi:hypothetical protein
LAQIGPNVVMSNNLVTSKSSFAPELPMRAIDELAVWQGPDFRNTSVFTHRLTDVEIAEILSVAFNDRCDMIVATVVLPHDRPAAIEPAIMEYLNSGTVLRWAEIVRPVPRS